MRPCSPMPPAPPPSRSRRSTRTARSCPTSIAGENPLTIYLDKRELVTLMTLGQAPEALVIGYLRNQRLVASIDDIEAVQVDWDIDSCAVTTRRPLEDIEARTARRTVTTGCGQGTVFGDLMEDIDDVHLPDDVPPRRSHAVWPARRRAPTRNDLQGGRRGAWLRAVSRHRTLVLRRGRRPPQRGGRDRRPDVARRASTAPTRSSTPPAG